MGPKKCYLKYGEMLVFHPTAQGLSCSICPWSTEPVREHEADTARPTWASRPHSQCPWDFSGCWVGWWPAAMAFCRPRQSVQLSEGRKNLAHSHGMETCGAEVPVNHPHAFGLGLWHFVEWVPTKYAQEFNLSRSVMDFFIFFYHQEHHNWNLTYVWDFWEWIVRVSMEPVLNP